MLHHHLQHEAGDMTFHRSLEIFKESPRAGRPGRRADDDTVWWVSTKLPSPPAEPMRRIRKRSGGRCPCCRKTVADILMRFGRRLGEPQGEAQVLVLDPAAVKSAANVCPMVTALAARSALILDPMYRVATVVELAQHIQSLRPAPKQ